ncbi:MAG: hypothetical protein ACOC00_02865 [Halothiobacillaceae bacterium]
MNRFLPLVMLSVGLTLLLPVSVPADPAPQGILTQQELVAVGNQYGQVQAAWQAEVDRHDARIREIESSSLSRNQKDFLQQREVRRHRAESQNLARQRQQVQDVLITEANARAGKSASATRQRIEASLGTSIDDPAHRGMRGDLDAQGGVRSVEALRQTLIDAGMDHVPVRETPGTLEIGTRELGGDFEVTVHKTGLEAPAGSQFAEIRDAVDARNHEVYLSERMRNRAAGTKQVGTDFVEVQDHFKKAAPGLSSSGQQLVDDPGRMQTLAKGTAKTLQIGDVSDSELAAIMRRHGIEGSPDAFRQRLQAIKEARIDITDPAEAGRIRDVGNEVFTRAEQQSYRRAQAEIETRTAEIERIRENIRKVDAMSDRPDTRARREALKKSLQAREQGIRNEIIDSRSKMRASAEASAELRQQSGLEPSRVHAETDAGGGRTPADPDGGRSVSGDGDSRPGPGSDTDSGRTPAADAEGAPRPRPGPDADSGRTPVADAEGTPRPRPDADAGRAPGAETQTSWQKAASGAARAYEVYGVVTDIADIGKAAKTLEEYMEGKVSAGQVVREALNLPPLSPVGTLVGTAEMSGQRLADYIKLQQELKKANETNLEAYLNQWALQFRKAGMTTEEARRYVAASMEAGNIDVLEARAARLRAEGHPIDIPVLVVEESPGPDGGYWYLWENTKDLGVGMAHSAYEGGEYIVTAPGRMVTALGERELEEAMLAYRSATDEADMKTRLFRALRAAGIDRERALDGVHRGGSALTSLTREARENIALAREEAARVEAERLALQERIEAVIARIERLWWMDLSLRTTPPTPIPIPHGTEPDAMVDIEVRLVGGLDEAVSRIERELTAITGQQPTIDTQIKLSLPGATRVDPETWKGQLPAEQDVYPLVAQILVRISGLPGDFAPLQRTVRRTVEEAVMVKTAEERIAFAEPAYEFIDGDYEPVHAVTENLDPEGAYYYYWTFRDQAGITDDPSWKLLAKLDEPTESQQQTATVALADLASGMLLDEAFTTVTVIPAEASEATREIDLFGNRVYWTTATPLANDPAVRLPESIMRVTPSVEGIVGEIRTDSLAWERLQALMDPEQSVDALLRAKILEQFAAMGIEPDEATVAQALRTTKAFSGMAGADGQIEIPELLAHGLVRAGQPVSVRVAVSLPMPPRIAVTFRDAQGAVSLDAQVRLREWALSTGFAQTQPVSGNNAAVTLEWTPEPGDGRESVGLNLLLFYEIDFYRRGTDEPYTEEGQPLRYENFSTFYPIGQLFLPVEQPITERP